MSLEGIPVDGRVAPRRQDVAGVLAGKVTGSLVVANGEIGSDGARGARETIAAVHGSASDLGGALPDDLAKVTPSGEVGHVGFAAVVVAVQVDLTVVKGVGDGSGDVVGRDTSSNVLTVATVVHVSVMGVDAGLGNLLRSAGKSLVPFKGRCRVVGAMGVVVLDYFVGIAAGRLARCWSLRLIGGRLRLRGRLGARGKSVGRGLVDRGGLNRLLRCRPVPVSTVPVSTVLVAAMRVVSLGSLAALSHGDDIGDNVVLGDIGALNERSGHGHADKQRNDESFGVHL